MRLLCFGPAFLKPNDYLRELLIHRSWESLLHSEPQILCKTAMS
ncbi:hypothetical protein SynA1560_00689 [Synechococcus sp. A15-60]|nr:hypothetical protein SynA1560_00689 [Synechococcus sp. A15-60]